MSYLNINHARKAKKAREAMVSINAKIAVSLINYLLDISKFKSRIVLALIKSMKF